MWIHLIIGLFFVAIGLAVHVCKCTSSSQAITPCQGEKANEIQALGRLMGIYSYVNGLFLLEQVSLPPGPETGTTPVMVFLGVTTIYMPIKAQNMMEISLMSMENCAREPENNWLCPLV